MLSKRTTAKFLHAPLGMAIGMLAASNIAAQSIDPEADWTVRSQSALYAENFTYPNTTALINAAAQVNGNLFQYVSLEKEHTLSGGGVRIAVPAGGGANTGSWNNYINGEDESVYRKFFLQLIVYADSHWLNYPFKQTSGSSTSPKLIIIDQWNQSFNPGEVVITNKNSRGFVTAYRGRDSDFPPFQLKIPGSETPCPNGDPDYLWQFPIDRGVPDPVVTCGDFKRRYGPLHYNLSGGLQQGMLLDQQGTPDPDASIGGVLWKKDGFTVVEVFIDHDEDIVKVWAAEYGKRPVLVVDSTVLRGGAELGGSGYTGFQLTPYRTNGASNEPKRQDTFVSYAELIVSFNPIAFPGGFDLPDGPMRPVRPMPPTDVSAQ